MARTKDQIADSIKASITGIDNRLDLKVGPLWDYLISPIPPELATLESQVEILKRYYSQNFSIVATPTEARNFAVNFGTGPSIGNFAKTVVVFYRNSAPSNGITYTVPIGALVQTIDGNLVFRTTQAATMSGDYAATYFNPSTQRYELSVPVEAVAPGIKYNIPANHIRKMQPAIGGFDGIIQYGAAVGGTEPEDSQAVAARVQEKFKGLERNSIGGITTLIKSAEPTLVGTVTVVKPTDRMEFRRLTSGPSLDVYAQGQNLVPFTEDYLAYGGEPTIPITVNRTAIGLSSLIINGTAIESTLWTFVPDTSLEYQYSTRANPKVQLDSTISLAANDLVEMTGTKNDLLDSLQAIFAGDNSLFYTDVLLRSFIELPIIVSLEARIITGDPDSIRGQIATVLTYFIEPLTGIPTILIPDTIQGLLKQTIPEIDTIKILEFRRKYGSINAVETVAPYKNQVPIFDTVAASITVRL